jgi:uncharacterized repeat protein (TIGR03803 family)
LQADAGPQRRLVRHDDLRRHLQLRHHLPDERGLQRLQHPLQLQRLFKINEDGTNFTSLKNFNGATGERPSGTPVWDSNGFFYGLTAYGGAHDKGTIYRVSADGSNFTVLHNFSTGGTPVGTSLTLGTDGVLYGITSQNNETLGEVFTINRNGTGFAVL